MSDIEVVQQIYAATADRDLETLAQLVDESCVITQEGVIWSGDGTSCATMTTGITR